MAIFPCHASCWGQGQAMQLAGWTRAVAECHNVDSAPQVLELPSIVVWTPANLADVGCLGDLPILHSLPESILPLWLFLLFAPRGVHCSSGSPYPLTQDSKHLWSHSCQVSRPSSCAPLLHLALPIWPDCHAESPHLLLQQWGWSLLREGCAPLVDNLLPHKPAKLKINTMSLLASNL